MAYKLKNNNSKMNIIVSPKNKDNNDRICISPSFSRNLQMTSPLTIISPNSNSRADSPFF